MNILVSRRSWLLAPALFCFGIAVFVVCWAIMTPEDLFANFDADGHSMVELMTLPLFAAIAPLSWLCCPVAGSGRRKAFWCSVFTFLAFMALVRELDWHKMWFAMLWPEVTASFKGVILPGWLDCGCGDELPVRPFAASTFYYSNRVNGFSTPASLEFNLNAP